MYLPKEIKNIIENEKYVKDTLGESGSAIYLYPNSVLKVSTRNKESLIELKNLNDFQHVLPIPRIIGYKITKRKVYILMSRIKGRPLLEYPIEIAIKLSCEVLYLLWSIDKYQTNTLDYKDALNYVEMNVLEDYQGLIDHADEKTYSEKFKDPRELLRWIKDNYPKEEEVVLSHGDLFLPNILSDGMNVTGIIDLGFMGMFPKERDIASLIKSFTYNYDINSADIKELIKDKLKITINDELIDYFLLYDELI